MGLDLVTAPTVEPVTWDDIRAASRLQGSEREKPLVEDTYIPAARQHAEAFTGRAFITQTWALKLSGFPRCGLYVPKPPLASISSISYEDSDGATQTLAADQYEYTTPAGERAMHGVLRPAYGVTWPATYPQLEAVTITFVCGYGADGSYVPAGIRRAIQTLVGEMLERREEVLVGTIQTPGALAAERLLWPFRVF